MPNRIQTPLDGWKTYIAAGALLGLAVLGYANGDIDFDALMRYGFEAIAIIGIRHAIGRRP